MAEGEVDYESDPEEAKLSLKMRRREASDDEEEEAEVRGGGDRPEIAARRIDDSEGESEGAAEEYEEEDDDVEEEEEEDEYDVDGEYVEDEVVAVVEKLESVGGGDVKVEGEKGVDGGGEVVDGVVDGGENEGEKKEVEPFAVPTAGAFYMHDDRFRENAGGRNRRTPGGKRLWESKDDRKWGHDKFEELTVQEKHYAERRRGSRGRNRGRGRNKGTDRINVQENRPREYSNNSTQTNNNQSNASKGVKGRGPRRYQQSFKNSNEAPVTQNKQSEKSVEKHAYVSSGRTTEPVSNAKSDAVLPRKQVASSLNIASPPFYPTGSSTKDNTMQFKRDVQAGTIDRNGQQSVVGESFAVSHSTATVRGKNIVDSMGVENLYIDDLSSGKPSNAMQMPLSGSSSINHGQSHLRGHGRGSNFSTHMAYQPVAKNQVNRAPPNQLHNVQRNPGQSRGQTSLQASVQQGTQRLPGGPQAFSPPKAVNTFESGGMESASESKTAVVAKGKGSVLGSGKGSFLYGGAQVMGASGPMGSGHSDQNFPAFLPVMQFGGQHPRGIPAVGMAFPGYVGQPQLGLGSSEMTWLPVLAGAAGALGASYCPPYITMDGSYNARPSGQASSIAAAISKENNSAKLGNDVKSAQRPELSNDDLGQRQKNPRRYTEMKFDQ